MSNTRKNTNDNTNIPIRVYLNKIKVISSSVQKYVEFLFILKGELGVVINNQRYRLVESDVVLINSGDVYEIHGEGENLILSMQIENDFFTSLVRREQSLFLCNSSINENEHYDDIRSILAKIMYEYSNRNTGYEFKIMSLLYDITYTLNTNFLITEDYSIQNLEVKSSKYAQRINNIVAYIKQNYNQQISLQDVADSQYLTPEYLSKFFKVNMGMTFSKYLNEFRLTQAVKELLRTDDSITKVAMNNGFPNLVAFNKIFKEVYDTTPAEYRNEVRKKTSKSNKIHNEKVESEIMKVDYNQAFEKLTKYVSNEDKSDNKLLEHSLGINVDVEANVETVKPIIHSWRNLINLGYAQDGLRSDLQQHLTNIQDKIKFKYARFQGIFSDEMFNFGEENDNEEYYNFTKIDKLIDFLYSINLKPFIELGNKAKVLNLATDKVMYFKDSSKRHKGFKESLVLLEKFIVHAINRYGINEVSQWYFEIWKEGDIEYVFWNGDFEKYLKNFQSYYNIIKRIVPGAKVGGPGFNPEVNMKWFDEFLNQVKKTGIQLDFLSISIYPYELIEDSKTEQASDKDRNKAYKKGEYLPHLLPSKDKNYSKVRLDKIRKMIKTSGTSIPEIHVTEYNSSISHRHPANDTTFKATFITKNILDNLDEIDSFGYWFCSDISGELKDSKNLLYGDMGLISANGINKPGFYAYEMLSKLGNDLIQKGDGYIITKKSSYNYEIITYNYKHFDYFYCLKEETPVSLEQYYNIYENQQYLNINIALKGIKSGRYRIKKYTLNREHGSIFDEWLNMNAIYNIKRDEIDYLKQICIPKQTVFYSESIDELKLESCLSPHEVNLYEITFEYS
ncbi:GH39 family glycosyl hydrolase [Clostridium fungisolvens]|uniref:HTH-type transcriptional activator RhaS n=1 Tax=Clostridium fungisolvens TaxID=1604897 RepID=A0A6V8SBT2_9CLOT|nr:helix-turn-helix domain-containing protein [Clostridium fungisolvens]GFP74699.1 HTH-type transcriptional activator RhaS [Clostridium fungisolvens]